jgi:hypothetical protein
MRSATVLPFILALSAIACSKHPTYGKPAPAPRDSVPTTKEPVEESAPPKPQEPGEVPNLGAGSSGCGETTARIW